MPIMTVKWKIDKKPIDYETALNFMEQQVTDIIDNKGNELVWLLEHPHTYTAGTSANDCDLLRKDIPTFKTGRGGQYTYHGPGQRIAYVMIDLKSRDSKDVKLYVHNLEEWIIKTLAVFNIKGERREGRVGIWVIDKNGKEKKIAALGVRLRKWVTMHGIAINLSPDLSYFSGIVPCGIKEFGVTSIKELGIDISMEELDKALKEKWSEVF